LSERRLALENPAVATETETCKPGRDQSRTPGFAV
jgi:hypothetical protein